MPQGNPTHETIVARATPPGRGGIAIVRISGSRVPEMARALVGDLPAARLATLASFRDADGEPIDDGFVLYFPAPDSFTGEHVLELHCHGGRLPVQMLVARVLELGARTAEPGEFSRRAFLNDKLDLSQAEAIADLIDSESRAAARAAHRSLHGKFSAAVLDLNAQITGLRVFVEAAIDFPDEEIDFLSDSALAARLDAAESAFDELARTAYQGKLLRDGVHLVLAGRPNAGKSTLLNALAGYDAAIVTEVPGTTRDLVREHIEIDGLPVHVIDTAGLRDDADPVEQEGVRRAREQIAGADHALLIVDAAMDTDDTVFLLRREIPPGVGHTIVRNKIDLTGEPAGPQGADTVNISARDGIGIDHLRTRIREIVGYEAAPESVTARQRHLDSLDRARRHFEEGRRQLADYAAGELLAEELLHVQNALAEITGEFTSDDLLDEIFTSFCIGK